MTKIFNVNLQDVFQAGVNAVIIAVFIGLGGLVSGGDFDVFSTDWVAVGKMVINWASAAFISSIGKDFLTTEKGNLLGVVKVKNPEL